MIRERAGGFIVTSSGRQFSYLDPRPHMIDICDIAHALSQICRFNGHTSLFYSVAQHSLLVADKMIGSAGERLAGLLHDAAEAYVCDIPSPLKVLLGSTYLDIHDTVLHKILEKFETSLYGTNVERTDKAACVFEAQAFFGFSEEQLLEHGYDCGAIGTWQDWDPKAYSACGDEEPGKVEADFLEAFETLQTLMLAEAHGDRS